jgi:FixJ family two-component response regulator
VRRVALLEDDEDLRAVTCHFISSLGAAHCAGFASLEALQADRDEVLRADLVILDVNLGRENASGVDAYYWLRAAGFSGEIVFLTGHARSHPQVAEAWRLPGVTVIEKPADLRVLAELATRARTRREEEPPSEQPP